MIIFATKNQGKLQEIREILNDIEIRSMTEAGFDMDIVEDGGTFENNAVLKATAVMRASGMPSMADDSGLEIDFLGKEPGVDSAYYLGANTSYEVRLRHILEQMRGVPEPERTARFICVIALAFPDGRVQTTRGVIEGIIASEPKGENGFGYDPIFYVPEMKMTTAKMPMEMKNALSHRGKALRAMRDVIRGGL